MTEAELRGLVTRECTRLGLLWHWCRDSRVCEGNRGLPDLVILGRGGILLAELKGPDGETSADQDKWLWHAWAASIPWAIWRPSDWDKGAIQRRLANLISRLSSGTLVYGCLCSAWCKLASASYA